MAFATPFGTVAAICRMIKIEHSVFALPFAYVGAFMAHAAAGGRGMPSWSSLLALTVAMVAVSETGGAQRRHRMREQRDRSRDQEAEEGEKDDRLIHGLSPSWR